MSDLTPVEVTTYDASTQTVEVRPCGGQEGPTARGAVAYPSAPGLALYAPLQAGDRGLWVGGVFRPFLDALLPTTLPEEV